MAKPIKVVAVCGCGVGSSVILRMNAQKALKELGIDATLEVADLTTAKGATKNADVVIVGKELASALHDVTAPIITMKNFTNKQEFIEKFSAYIAKQEEKK